MNTEVSSNQTAVLPQGVSVANPWVRLGSYFLEAILMMVTLGIGWLIWACMTASSGQTPAKKMLKLRVIDANTLKPSGFGKMFWVRGILAGMVAQLAILCTLGILLFMPFWISEIKIFGTKFLGLTLSTTQQMLGKRNLIWFQTKGTIESRVVPGLNGS